MKMKKLTDGGIVYAVNDHLFDTSFLESFLILKVSWDLLCGSCGCEGSWKTNYNDVLSRAVLGNIDHVRVRESSHEVDGRDFRWGSKC